MMVRRGSKISMSDYYEILIKSGKDLFFWGGRRYRYVSEAEKAHNNFYNANHPQARRRKLDQPLGDCDCVIVLCTPQTPKEGV